MRRYCCLALLALLGAVGCTSTETRLYNVTVSNLTSGDVTVWLTKSASLNVAGGPRDPVWASPVDAEEESPQLQELATKIVLHPQQRGSVQRSGEFYRDGEAYLRVYRYTTREAILSADRGSRNRDDLVLMPGTNVITIVDDAGRLRAIPVQR